MTRARTAPAFPPGGAPVSFLVDYDGTISLRDVGDALVGRHVRDPLVAVRDAEYDAGLVGSRELMRWDMDVLPADAGLLRRDALAIPQDDAFPRFVAAARARGAAVEVVSDGLGFYIEPKLAALGLADLPVATNENRLEGGGAGMAFPYGHPRCFVCGTCKRERVRAHRAAGHAVVFIGDGTSDRYAAAHADLVFARDGLARICRAEGWAYRPWRSFEALAAWVGEAFAGGELPVNVADYAAWRARLAAPPRPFICGPEVWGEGRTTPGPASR